MNNYKMDYAKKYHYVLKYFILGFPLLLFIFASINASSSNTYFSSLSTYVSSCVKTFVESNSFLSWYTDLLGTMNITLVDNYIVILEVYPLYVLAVYVFDVLIDVLGIFPRLIHKCIEKIGGDY